MALNLKVFSANYKLCATNYKAKGPRMMAKTIVRGPFFVGAITDYYKERATSQSASLTALL